MLRKILATITGLLAAFITMLAFEYTNSLIFPFPEGMDLHDPAQVQAFTKTLPWSAYTLVLLGWTLGACFAGAIATKLSKSKTQVLPTIVGTVLTALGIFNFILIKHPVIVIIIGAPLFYIFTFLGHKLVISNPQSR